MSYPRKNARLNSQSASQVSSTPSSSRPSLSQTGSSGGGISRINGLFHHIHPASSSSESANVGDSYLVHSSFVPIGLSAPPSHFPTPSKSGRVAAGSSTARGTWTLRIGQQHRRHGDAKSEKKEEDHEDVMKSSDSDRNSSSDTESDEDEDSQGTLNEKSKANGNGKRESETTPERAQIITKEDETTYWYEAVISQDDVLNQAKGGNHGEEEWSTLELRIRVAWDAASLDVMASERKRLPDGSYPSVRLAIDRDGVSSQDAESVAEREEKKGTSIEITLTRLKGAAELRAATTVCAELMKVASFLKGKTQHLVEERDTHRRLLQNNRKNERYKEANSSLVNPGRIKRKLEDDEGFEGD